jgi:hypothetical protein
MSKGSCCSLLFFLSLSTMAFSQQQMSGKIEKKGSSEILIGVNVTNLSQKKFGISDLGGNYRIPALPADTLIFSSSGYLPDTLFVRESMFTDNYLVLLNPRIVMLPSVKVDEMKNYQLDSIKKREDYRFIYEKKHPVKLWNEKRPGDGPGLNFSPIGYLSRVEKQKRRLKKRLRVEEEEDYIDYRFSPSRVAQLTRLKGDSLQIFMLRFRPSYKFCRIASNQDILLYTNDKLKLFRKSKL